MLAAACGKGPGAPCLYATDCDEGLACFAETCHELGTPDGAIAWMVLPPSWSDLVPAAFPSTEAPLELSLCNSSVSGHLGFEGGALLVAKGELSSLPGLESRHEMRVQDRFTLNLPAGAWTLTFHPDPPGPPLVRKVQLARCENRELSTIETPPAGYRTARLRLVVDPERDPRPACGAFLRVIDPETGAPLSSRLERRAAPGSACAEPPEVALPFALPSGDSVEILVGPLEAARPAIPEQRLLVPIGDEPVVDLGRIGANPGGAALEQVIVSVVSPVGTPIVGAIVTAETIQAASAPAPSDGDSTAEPARLLRFRSGAARSLGGGRYELWLLPGRYAFHAEPPPGAGVAAGGCVSPAGSSCGPAFTVEAGAAAVLEMRLAGQVIVRGSSGPRGGTIETRPARQGGGRSASGSLESDGSYELALDPGDYDLTVRPFDPAIPWLVRPLGAPLVADSREDLSMPSPALLIGTIWEGDAKRIVRIPDAVVRAYRLVPGQPPALVGETVSQADGTFSVVLPGR